LTKASLVGRSTRHLGHQNTATPFKNISDPLAFKCAAEGELDRIEAAQQQNLRGAPVPA
jgi:hypothetical protein